MLKLQLFSPEDARYVRGQRRRPERVAQLGRVSTRFCFISFISDRDGEILVSLHPFFSLGESYAVVKCGCISPAFYAVLVSVLTGMCYAVPKTSGRLRHEADAILGQRFDDSGFVRLWFIRQQLLLWCMVVGICGTGVHRSGCAHCGVHAALSILPPVLGYDVFYRRENVLPALRQ